MSEAWLRGGGRIRRQRRGVRVAPSISRSLWRPNVHESLRSFAAQLLSQ